MDEEGFLREELTQDGVVRQLEIIGEAAKGILEDMRSAYPHIPWRSMAGMRDKLIHAYFSVDLHEVFRTARQDLPALRIEIEKILLTRGQDHDVGQTDRD
ncbi:MAG: DUF86 domain-containing protein [Blastocatellia bacterium]